MKGRTRETTHNLMISAAIETFGELGYGRTSLAAIAKRAGVSPAALCQHFGDKNTLYEAATDAIYGSMVIAVDQLSAKVSLAELVDRSYEHAEMLHVGVRFLLRRILEGGGIDRRVRTKHVGPVLDRASEVVARKFRVPQRRARETLVVIGHLIARFVTNSEADNCVALAADDPLEARERIVALLTSTAEHLLGVDA